jgi:hypothetical protein
VDGLIESTVDGFKFPDGTTQNSAALPSTSLGTMATQDASSVDITGGNIAVSAGFGGAFGYKFASETAGFQALSGDASLNFAANTSIYSQSSATSINFAVSAVTVGYFTSTVFQVNVDAYKPGGGTWLATSDSRTKKDIIPYNLSTEQLFTLNPVSYRYNGLYGTQDLGKTYVGLIAQEVQETPFSSMVGSYNHGDVVILNVDSSQIIYALINAVKDLSDRIKSLEAEQVS